MRMTDLYSKRDAGTVYQLETKTLHPTMSPTPMPSGQPTSRPSIPRALESSAPTDQPSSSPSIRPSELNRNSSQPSSQPSARPSSHPYLHPTSQPTMTISNLVPLSPGAQGSGMMKSAPRLKGGAIAGIVIMVLLVIGFASIAYWNRKLSRRWNYDDTSRDILKNYEMNYENNENVEDGETFSEFD